MKIEDRIQALKRSTKYRKDYKKYDEYRRKNNIVDSFLLDNFAPLCRISEEGQKLCAKYKIPFPFNPDGEVEVLPGSQTIPLERGISVPSVLPMPIRKTKDGKQVFGLFDKRYLNISIDMTRLKKEIFQDIEKLCQYYKTQIDDKKRNKSASLNCWDIYDKVKGQKSKSVLLVAKGFYGFTKNPAYCEEAMNCYKLVKRAYEKAERLMREFES